MFDFSIVTFELAELVGRKERTNRIVHQSEILTSQEGKNGRITTVSAADCVFGGKIEKFIWKFIAKESYL